MGLKKKVCFNLDLSSTGEGRSVAKNRPTRFQDYAWLAGFHGSAVCSPNEKSQSGLCTRDLTVSEQVRSVSTSRGRGTSNKRTANAECAVSGEAQLESKNRRPPTVEIEGPGVGISQGPVLRDFRARTAAGVGTRGFVWFGQTSAKRRQLKVAGAFTLRETPCFMLIGDFDVGCRTRPGQSYLGRSLIRSKPGTDSYRVYLNEPDAKRVSHTSTKSTGRVHRCWNAEISNCTLVSVDIARFHGIGTVYLPLQRPGGYLSQKSFKGDPRRSPGSSELFRHHNRASRSVRTSNCLGPNSLRGHRQQVENLQSQWAYRDAERGTKASKHIFVSRISHEPKILILTMGTLFSKPMAVELSC